MRLTWTKEDGTWGVTGMDFNLAKLSPVLYGALAKLKDYEMVCDSPDKLKEIDELYREKCEEVNALKAKLKLKENDLLLKLSCKVGDDIYDINSGEVEKYRITGYSFGTAEDYMDTPVAENEVVYYYRNPSGSITGSFGESAIGELIFLSPNKAEEALKQEGLEEKAGD